MDYGTCCAHKLHAKSRPDHKIIYDKGASCLAVLDNRESVRAACGHKRRFLTLLRRTAVRISVADRCFSARRKTRL